MTEIIKSLKYIDLSSITIIGTSINFFFSIIMAIILAISLIISTGSADISIIILLLAMVFMVLIFSIPDYFGRAYLFNFLISKLKEINIEIIDMEKITNISVFSSAIVCSIISLIVTTIIFPGILVVGSLLSLILQFLAPDLFYLVLFVSSPSTIAFSFIFTFISVAIAASVFNLISPKIGGLRLNLTQEGNMTVINSINYLNLALILAVISAVMGLILCLFVSVYLSISLMVVLSLIIYLVLGGFVGGFIIGALMATFYNFLAPRMGELKVELV